MELNENGTILKKERERNDLAEALVLERNGTISKKSKRAQH